MYDIYLKKTDRKTGSSKFFQQPQTVVQRWFGHTPWKEHQRWQWSL